VNYCKPLGYNLKDNKCSGSGAIICRLYLKQALHCRCNDNNTVAIIEPPEEEILSVVTAVSHVEIFIQPRLLNEFLKIIRIKYSLGYDGRHSISQDSMQLSINPDDFTKSPNYISVYQQK
jgi:hypothetical protein